ncbi:MAG: hypothetical protein KAQ67_05585, partial [Gammaproteobacteria bacterium]|nr:hypothetical protein [Gammaproteobacteria bacterium]
MALNNTVTDKEQNSILKLIKQDDLDKIANANHHNPFSILGNQTANSNQFLIFYSPETLQLTVTEKNIPTIRLTGSDFFVCCEQIEAISDH